MHTLSLKNCLIIVKHDKCKKCSPLRANPGNISCFLLLWKLLAECAIGREPYTDNSSYADCVSISRLWYMKHRIYVKLLEILVWRDRSKWRNFTVDDGVFVCCSSFQLCRDIFVFIWCTNIPCDISGRSQKRKCNGRLMQLVKVKVTDDEEMRFLKAKSKVRTCKSTKKLGMNLLTGKSSERHRGSLFYECCRWRNILSTHCSSCKKAELMNGIETFRDLQGNWICCQTLMSGRNVLGNTAHSTAIQ
jgi:hypothetical protein